MAKGVDDDGQKGSGSGSENSSGGSMIPWGPIISGGGALLGGLGGKEAAKAANAPSDSTGWKRTVQGPYGGEVGTDLINDLLRESRGAYYDNPGNQQNAYDAMQGAQGIPTQGPGLYGHDIGQYGPGASYEIPGFDVAGDYQFDQGILDRIKGGGGGGGGGGSSKWGLGDLDSLQSRLQGAGVDQSQYMQDVLGGDYLGANQYTDDVVSGYQADAAQSFNEIAAPQLAAQAQSAGAQGGTMAALANAMAQERANEDVNQQVGQLRMDMYEGERDRQQEMQNILSGENVSLRGDLAGGFSDLEASKASRYGSDKAAGASRYGSRLGALSDVLGLQQRAHEFSQDQSLNNYQFETGLGESISREAGDDMQRAYEYEQAQLEGRLAGDRSYQGQRYDEALRGQGQGFNQAESLFGAAGQMDTAQQDRIAAYIAQIVPMLSGFGETRQTYGEHNEGANRGLLGAAATGALGGGLAGYGAYNAYKN